MNDRGRWQKVSNTDEIVDALLARLLFGSICGLVFVGGIMGVVSVVQWIFF